MVTSNIYVDMLGNELSLAELEKDERELVAHLQDRGKKRPDWNDFDNFWQAEVAAFYDRRGIPRQRSRLTVVYKIAQDISNRLAVAAGMARLPDYRDDLEQIIRQRFDTRRQFCEATGLSEDMLSHVLAHRKHFSLETLTHALNRIGCVLHIMPRQDIDLKT